MHRPASPVPRLIAKLDSSGLDPDDLNNINEQFSSVSQELNTAIDEAYAREDEVNADVGSSQSRRGSIFGPGIGYEAWVGNSKVTFYEVPKK